MKKPSLTIYFLFIIFLISLFASAGLTATPSQDRSTEFLEFELKGADERFTPVEENYEKAVRHFNNRECGEALRLLEFVVDERPNFAQAYFLKGCCEGTLERYQESIKSFNKVISIDQNYKDVHLTMGIAYYNLDRYNEAVEYLKKAILLKPEDPKAHYKLGATYYLLASYEEAIESFKKAASIKPKNALYHYSLGVAYGDSRRFKDAVKSFKKAVKLDPGFASAYFNLGLAYLPLADEKSALKQYKALKEIDLDRANELLKSINNVSEKVKSSGRPQKPPVPIFTGKEEGPNISDLAGSGYTKDSSWYAKGTGGNETFIEKFVNSKGDVVLRISYKDKVFGYSIISKTEIPYTLIDSQCRGDFDKPYSYFGSDKFPMPECLLK